MVCRRDQEKSPGCGRVLIRSAGSNTTIPMTVYNGFHDMAAVPARSMSVLRRRRDKPQILQHPRLPSLVRFARWRRQEDRLNGGGDRDKPNRFSINSSASGADITASPA